MPRWRPLALLLVLALLGPAALAPPIAASNFAAETLTLQLSPDVGPNGTVITLRGRGAAPFAEVGYIYGGFATLDECYNNRTSGQGMPGGTGGADQHGRFALTHIANEGPTTGAIRFAVTAAGGQTSPWACFQIGAGMPHPGRYFPETGKTVRGRFLDYWEQHGGLAQQGLPLTDAFVEVNPVDGKPYTVQYFERARFESHPENPAPYDVLLGLLGREQLQAKYPNGIPTSLADAPLGANCAAFPETGKQVCGVFFDYWQTNGGLAQQGLPLTDLFLETNPTDGKQYPTQYFERARFEYHAENLGTPYVVLLGLLGREQYLTPFLQDDFGDKRANWPEGPSIDSEAHYADGGYHIRVTAPNRSLGASPDGLEQIADVRVSVDATWRSGDNQTNAGIRCRRAGAGNYYVARFFPTGVYDIAIIQAGTFRSLASGGLPGALRTGLGATNRLEFACIGDTLTLGANGKVLLTVRDTTFAAGGIYLAVASTVASQTGAESRFDNFLATRP